MIQIDMQMPKNCADCCFATADLVNGIITLFCMTQAGRRMYAPDLISRKDRPEWCPLKEQEAVEPHYNARTNWYECGACKFSMTSGMHCKGELIPAYKVGFCAKCGQAVKWE